MAEQCLVVLTGKGGPSLVVVEGEGGAVPCDHKQGGRSSPTRVVEAPPGYLSRRLCFFVCVGYVLHAFYDETNETNAKNNDTSATNHATNATNAKKQCRAGGRKEKPCNQCKNHA